MRIRLTIFALVFIFVINAYCDDVDQARTLFYKGNAYYAEEKFEEAIAQYENALRLGFESGAIYYNLGNAYFKNGSLGKAILNYLRAQRLIPEDADLKSNLEYAQSLIKEKVVVAERKWFLRLLINLADKFNLDSATLSSSILYSILMALLIFFILAKKIRRVLFYASSLVLILLIISSGIFFVQFHKALMQKQAVVVVKESKSKFEPFDDATTHFILSEGDSVIAVTSKKDWVKILRSDGKQGWIKKQDIELL